MVLEWAEEACRVGGRLDKIVQLKWGRCVRRLNVYERLWMFVRMFFGAEDVGSRTTGIT